MQPDDIAGLLLWLKADGIVGLSDGDAVATWLDETTNNNDFSQATASFRPVYKTNILNGKPIVRFDGIDNGLISANPIIPASDFTLFIVLKSASNQSDLACPFEQGLASPTVAFTLQFQSFDAPFLCFGGSNNTDYRLKNYAATDTNLHLITRHHLGTTGKIWLDGVLETLSTVTTGPTYGADITSFTATMAAAASDRDSAKLGFVALDDESYRDRFWDGDIAEVIIYDSGLSDANRQAIESYLASKYGISGITTTSTSTSTTTSSTTTIELRFSIDTDYRSLEAKLDFK